MRHRESQVRDTGFEVVHEADNCAIVLPAVVSDDAGRKIARDRSAWRRIGCLHADFELRLHVFRQLGHQIAHAVGKAALPGSEWEANLDRLDDSGCPI